MRWMNWKSYLAYKKRRFADDRKIRICRATSKVCTSKVRIDVKKLYKVLIALSKYRLNKVDRMVKNMIKLGDVATYINGYAFKPKDRSKRGLPIIRIQDLTGNSYDLGFYDGTYPQKIEINDGDVLISWSASLGVYIWNRGKALLNQHIFKVEFDKADIDKNYFVFAVRHKLKEMGRKTHGATMKHIVKKDFESTEIPYPSYEKQVEIATNLNKIFRIIESRNKELQLLDELIKARFVELFGDPANNEKGFIKAPMGDYMTLLTDFSSNGSYKTLDSRVTMYDEPKYAWMVRTTDLESGDMTSVKYIDESAYELLSRSKIYGGEIIMNKIGSAGKIYLMPQINMPASLGRNAFMFRYDEHINVKFLYHLLTSEYGQREIQQYVRGAVTKTITKNDARSVLIIVPPIELQNEFEVFVAQVDKSKVIAYTIYMNYSNRRSCHGNKF